MHSNHLLLAAATGLAYLAHAQNGHHIISGAPVPSEGTVPLRLNINDLQAAGGPPWDLFIQALKAMQGMDSDDPLSYFQTAGIHGMPYIEWDNSGARRGSNWLGYCPHGEPLFLPWHRPYVLLFEQELVKHATEIAKKYPASHRDEYVEAARNLRTPYWDWSAESAVPPASVPFSLTINVADGDNIKSSSVTNPLQTYNLPSAALNGRYGTFDRYQRPQINRCPPPSNSYPDSANSNLRNRNIRGNLYAAFVYAQDFNQFSQTGNNGIGLEQIHNWIHYDASCGEQFWEPDLSGFDPLFMLHHANLDRLWAYWQYMKPSQAIFNNDYYGQSRYASAQGTVISPDSELQPFFGSAAKMHTTRSIASIDGMGYSYEGLQYWNMSSTDLQKAATAIINTKYGSQVSTNPGNGMSGGPWKRGASNSRQPAGQALQSMQYFVRFEVDRTHVERPSTVAVFFGGIKAGDVAVMAQPSTGIMKGSFVIDSFVRDAFAKTESSYGTMQSISHLVHIEVTKPDAARVPLSSIPSLKVRLEAVPFTPPASVEKLPVLGTPVVHHITLVEHVGHDN